jgi:MFS family permease
MNTLTTSPLLLSLLSTSAALPFFFLTFPAGAIADMANRKIILCVMHVWLALAAGGLAFLSALHMLSPPIILGAVFLLGVGFACNAPAWMSVVPEVVSKEELPSAIVLGGVQLNISGIIGPALGGLLLPLIGPTALFALNGLAFLLVLGAILQWRQKRSHSVLPSESLIESFFGAVRYVRYSQTMQVVLLRAFLFAFLISVVPSLLPVVGLQALKLTPSSLGVLFTSMGVGSLLGAVFVVPWAREKWTPNTVTILASVLLAVVYFLMGTIRNLEAFMLVAALAGLGWTLAASELWVAAQQAMPGWTRGRLNAAQMMVSQGGIALGGLVWGSVAAFTGFEYTLLLAALFVFLNLSVAGPLSIDFARTIKTEPAPPMKTPEFPEAPDLDEGPIAVVAEITIDRQKHMQFLDLMRELRRIYLRNGASSVRLYESLSERSIFRMEAVAPTWREYLMLQRRLTKSERDILDRVLELHSGTAAKVDHYLLITRDLLAPSSIASIDQGSDGWAAKKFTG